MTKKQKVTSCGNCPDSHSRQANAEGTISQISCPFGTWTTDNEFYSDQMFNNCPRYGPVSHNISYNVIKKDRDKTNKKQEKITLESLDKSELIKIIKKLL